MTALFHPTSIMSEAATTKSAYNPKNPFIAHLKHAHDLTGAAAAKHTKHYEIDLAGSGMDYLPGDSLAVQPMNDPALVDLNLRALGFSGDETVTNPKGGTAPIRQVLLEVSSLTEFDGKLLKLIAEKSGNADLAGLTTPEKKDELKNYMWGRDVLDVLEENPTAKPEPAEFIAALRRMNVRLYSISSSLRAHPEEVHLTVATVRYESRGRMRGGVCSTFLADRVDASTPLPTFIKSGAGFRLPEPESDTPIIMCGPGTGIAPFRAFCQERKATAAKGDAWLFFGEINRSTCFFYESEWDAYLADGTLKRIDTAFSRDQEKKLYVQHKMIEQGRDLYDWLENGAIFYICGDASRMATDVDHALSHIVAEHGGKNPDQVAEYMENLKTTKRYRRDVY
jgi:sulfite reductase (NADPH) flavoprotein alpha-component